MPRGREVPEKRENEKYPNLDKDWEGLGEGQINLQGGSKKVSCSHSTTAYFFLSHPVYEK